MDFENYLLESAQKTKEEVDNILNKWRGEAGGINKSLLPLIDEFIKSNHGGKGIRGILVKLGFEIAQNHLGGAMASQAQPAIIRGEIYKIAAAYEILHTSILAHDDIMDEDTERRGMPSLYQALGGNHYGISQAISLADAGFFLAVKIIAESNFDEKLKNQALALFAKVMVDTSLGQMLDVDHIDPETTAKLKTARYTICGPLKIGAILSGADAKLLNLLDSFGENLGIAYQIRDDILDSEVRSVDQAKKRVLEYSDKALKLIPEIAENTGYKKLLEELTKYLVDRKK